MLQQELLNVHAPFASIGDAQAAVDAWRKEYNTGRPHQSLSMGFPSARFTPAAAGRPGLADTGRAHADGQVWAVQQRPGRRHQAVTGRAAS